MSDHHILEEALKAQMAGLHEFGYPSVTLDGLRRAHRRWRRGEEAKGVIDMFAFKDYEERPELFGRKDQPS